MTDSLERFASAATEVAAGVRDGAVELVTGRDLETERSARNAQAHGNEERDGIHTCQSELGGRFTGDWDSQVFVEESFDSMSHEDIMASVDRMDPAAVDASARGWTAIGDALAEALDDFKAAITSEMNAGWSGVAHDAAASATANYVTASDQLAVAGLLVGTKVAEVSTGITQVKATVPPPENSSFFEKALDYTLPRLTYKAFNHERTEAREQAVQIMKTVYSPVMREADTRVPTLPAPVSVVAQDQSQTAGTPQGAGSSAGSNPTSTYTGPSNSGAGGTPSGGTADAGSTAHDAAGDGATTAAPQPGMADAGTAPSGLEDGDGAGHRSLQQDSPAAWTRPAAVGGDGIPSGAGQGGPGPGHVPSGVTGSGGSTANPYGGAGASGTGGWGVGAHGGGVNGGSGAVGGIVGGPGVVPAAGAASPGSVAAAARGGAAMPAAGMMPAAARGAGGDDTEHATPGYLVTVDNGNDIVGTLPLVAPPVLGA
ncbi:hypothetical protein ACFYVR_20680 [Rhodococcus sp. NPDC003318]|uniref:hypothetical protein n=1 Tax=Rhodococcus sp. NPDC003318 TaxID=3364503 RepID=UPI00368F08F8